MSNPDSIEFSNRQIEAEEYLKKHKINELFSNITSHLVFNKPESPKDSIIDYLERLKKSQLANLNPPTLFEDPNLQSIFGMLDPSGRGFITFKQYSEALRTLGIIDFEANPDGKADDKIKMDAFLREAKKASTELMLRTSPNENINYSRYIFNISKFYSDFF